MIIICSKIRFYMEIFKTYIYIFITRDFYSLSFCIGIHQESFFHGLDVHAIIFWAYLKNRNYPITPCGVVVYHVTIVAIGHGLLKKFWHLVIGCVLRTAGSSIIWKLCRPAYFVRTTQLLPHPGLTVPLLMLCTLKAYLTFIWTI